MRTSCLAWEMPAIGFLVRSNPTMEVLLTVLVGAAVGFVGNAPALFLCRMARKRSYANMGAAFVVLLVSFLFFSVALFAAFKLQPDYFIVFALICIGSFLVSFIAEAVCAYKWMNRTKRKR